jgi:hypothetical protein
MVEQCSPHFKTHEDGTVKCSSSYQRSKNKRSSDVYADPREEKEREKKGKR